MNAKKIFNAFFVLAILLMVSFSCLVIAEEPTGNTKNIFIDSDQDGLSDEEEKVYKTDPYKADSDNDGYSDGVEVGSGYDPLRPAPGDKIIKTQEQKNNLSSDDKENNLTQNVTKKISSLIKSDNGEEQEVTMDEIQSIIDETLSEQSAITENDLPEIADKDIKIKKQNYGSLSKDKKQEKMKEDFLSYTTSIAYIFSSNSPKAITSSDDISGLTESYANQIVSALTTRKADELSDISDSGQKIFDQMKTVEVPEDAKEMHIKGLKLAQYALNLKKSVNANAQDPVSDIVGLSKIQSFLEIIMTYSEEVNSKFSEYGISYTDAMDKIKDLKSN